MRKKIAIVVQRYGLEVNGGAELHARLLAEKLATKYDIEILTTTALDYNGWKNYYPSGKEMVNEINVRRFPTIEASDRQLRRARRAIFGNKKYFRILKKIGVLDFLDRQFSIRTPSKRDVNNWLIRQGPYCPEMLNYIKANRNDFDVFIFFTYLYYPTASGMKIVPEKSIFIPTAHDEEIMFTKAYEEIYSLPAYIMYNTESERSLVENNFRNVVVNNNIAGVGVTSFPNFVNTEELLQKYKLNVPYFLYVGRIDRSKGCDELIAFFNKYNTVNQNVKLLLVGKDYMSAKTSDNVIMTGFVDDEVKNALLSNCMALIMPSTNESLSMVTLEAMAEGKTVIVNGLCEVLKDHVLNSGTGFYYQSYAEFKRCLDAVFELSEREKMKISENATAYVRENYSWESILEKFDKAIDLISNGK